MPGGCVGDQVVVCCGVAVEQQGGRILGENRAWHICKQCLEFATLLTQLFGVFGAGVVLQVPQSGEPACQQGAAQACVGGAIAGAVKARKVQLAPRPEEHASELQSLMRISYAVFCMQNKNDPNRTRHMPDNK